VLLLHAFSTFALIRSLFAINDEPLTLTMSMWSSRKRNLLSAIHQYGLRVFARYLCAIVEDDDGAFRERWRGAFGGDALEEEFVFVV
jgi:hypothetical protein